MSDDFRSLQNGREVCGLSKTVNREKNSVEFGKKCPNQRSHMEKHYASSNRQVGKLSICTYHIMYKYINNLNRTEAESG